MKATISCLLLFAWYICIGQSPYTQLTPFYENRSGTAVFEIDGNAYVFGGASDGFNGTRKDLWLYDPSPQIPFSFWQQKASLPGLPRHLAVGFALNGYGYVGTGDREGYGENLRDFYRYDPVSNTWTQIADFPLKIQNGYSFVVNGRAFVGGGFVFIDDYDPGNDYASNGLYEYLPSSNSWQLVSNSPVDFVGSVSFVVGNKAYVGFHVNSSARHAFFYEYNVETNSWSQKATFPGGIARLDAISFASSTRGYVGTGRNAQTLTEWYKDFWEYKPSINTWTRVADLPGPSRAGGVGIYLNGRAYIGLGADANDWFEYNRFCDFEYYAVTGPELICSAGTFTNQNLPEGNIGTWSSSNVNGLNINSNGIAVRQNNFNGFITITSTITGCGTRVYTKSVAVGTPAPSITVLETPKPRGSVYHFTATPYAGSTYKWYVNNIAQSSSNNTFIATLACGMSKTVKCTQTNSCGTSGFSNSITIGGSCNMEVAATPNPVSDELIVSFPTQSRAEINELILLNSQQEEVYSSRVSKSSVVIPVQNFPEGIYYLFIKNRGIVETRRISIKR